MHTLLKHSLQGLFLISLLFFSDPLCEKAGSKSYSQDMHLSSDFQYANNQNLNQRSKHSLNHFVSHKSVDEIKKLLQVNRLNGKLIDKIITTLSCVKKNQIDLSHFNNILSIIDYTLPSNKKRLWVFDLSSATLLFHTYVSHAVKSGDLYPKYFSNEISSLKSSLGLYKTQKTYFGHHGIFLELVGLEKFFNDQATKRTIVMHGAWYLNENFILRYGKPGRSFGCFSVPLELAVPLLNSIKDQSLLIAYYPDQEWFSKSEFLNCHKHFPQTTQLRENIVPTYSTIKKVSDEILFADLNNDGQRESNEPIVTIAAKEYYPYFHKNIPIQRMLRAQIDNREYIAVNNDELNYLKEKNNHNIVKNEIMQIYFIFADVQRYQGMAWFKMRFLNVGKLNEINCVNRLQEIVSKDNCIAKSNKNRPISLRTTSQFLPWLGL